MCGSDPHWRPSNSYRDLNFKVPNDFYRRYKKSAVYRDMKGVELLVAMFEFYEKHQPIETSPDDPPASSQPAGRPQTKEKRARRKSWK